MTTATPVAASLTGLILLPVLALATTGHSDPACLTTATALSPSAEQQAVNWDAEQRTIATTVITLGRARSIPPRGQVIALATAMQESGLRNLPGGDADSIGVFQQRPSQGWGTPAQLTSVTYQTDRFYDALLALPGWQSMPLTQAAQAVQRSAYPDAYARWTTPAIQLLHDVGSTNPRAIPEDLEQSVSTAGCTFGGVGCASWNKTPEDLEHSTAQPQHPRPTSHRLLTNSQDLSAHQPPDDATPVLGTAHGFVEPAHELNPATEAPLLAEASTGTCRDSRATGSRQTVDRTAPARLPPPTGTPPAAGTAVTWALAQLGTPTPGATAPRFAPATPSRTLSPQRFQRLQMLWREA